MSCTSSGRADVFQNQAVHWEDGPWEHKEGSLEFWGWNDAVTKADLCVRLRCQGWADLPLWPSLSQNVRVAVGIFLSLTLGPVEELHSLGCVFLECSWLFTSHPCTAGLPTRSAANPPLLFPFYFPPSLERWWIFHCCFFSGGEITKWCLVHCQPAGFQSIQEEWVTHGGNSMGWHSAWGSTTWKQDLGDNLHFYGRQKLIRSKSCSVGASHLPQYSCLI